MTRLISKPIGLLVFWQDTTSKSCSQFWAILLSDYWKENIQNAHWSGCFIILFYTYLRLKISITIDIFKGRISKLFSEISTFAALIYSYFIPTLILTFLFLFFIYLCLIYFISKDMEYIFIGVIKRDIQNRFCKPMSTKWKKTIIILNVSRFRFLFWRCMLIIR